MNPSPFEHNLSGPQKTQRITVTIGGPPGSGKSTLANYILSSLRAQQFQTGLTDTVNDSGRGGPRFHQHTIVAIEVKEDSPPMAPTAAPPPPAPAPVAVVVAPPAPAAPEAPAAVLTPVGSMGAATPAVAATTSEPTEPEKS